VLILEEPRQLELAFSEQCNLNCSYCYLNKKNKSVLSEERAHKAIDEFSRMYSGNRIISFSTGEPLLHYPVLKELITARPSRVVITTNGTLLTKDKISFLKEYGADIVVSIDGIADTHDSARIFKRNRKPTHERIIRNIVGAPRDTMSALITYTPATVYALKKSVEYLIAQKFKRIDFFPDLWSKPWDRKSCDVAQNQIEQIARDLLIRTNTRRFTWGYASRLSEKRSSCSKIYCSPEGVFFICDKVVTLPKRLRKEFAFGDVETGIDHGRRTEIFSSVLKKFDVMSNEFCARCDLRRYCFCPLGFVIHYSALKKDFARILKSFCWFSKLYLKHAFSVN